MGDEVLFALYRGDELLGIGTADELAEMHGVNADTIRFYSTPSHRKRIKDESKSMIAVRIEP